MTPDEKYPLPVGDIIAIWPIPRQAEEPRSSIQRLHNPLLEAMGVATYEVNMSEIQPGILAGIVLAKGADTDCAAEVRDVVYYPEQCMVDIKGFHFVRDHNIFAYDPHEDEGDASDPRD